MVYIAGPMSGLSEYNLPAFAKATKELTDNGFVPINPGRDYDPSVSCSWKDCMRLSLSDLLKCDGIALLPGWTDSRGATLELYVATQIGMDVRPLAEWLV